jgi:glutamate-5-semialdehyde dehydrogenase
MTQDPNSYILNLARAARRAASQLATLSDATKRDALTRIAAALRSQRAALLDANQKDIAAAQQAGTH